MIPDKKIEAVRSINQTYLKKIHKLGIKTVKDLFFHFPHRYDDFTTLKKIKEVKINENIAIEGEIKEIETRKTFRRRMFITEALIQDESGVIRVIWFNQPYIDQNLKKGHMVSLVGKVNEKDGKIFISNPSYERIIQGKKLKHTRGLVPIYPETKGLSSRWIRFIIYPLLQKYAKDLKEFLPTDILEKNSLPKIDKAILQIHFPKTKKEAEFARKRFSFEKLFLIQIFIQKQKIRLDKKMAPKIYPRKKFIKEFKRILPFEFTTDQKRSIREVLNDLQKGKPMSRLLEGEVGSGKTIVATLAAYICAKNKNQAAIMAPTEILAEQHFFKISKLLSPLDIKVGLLTSEVKKINSEEKIKENEIIKKVEKGDIDIIIGTHSLIQEKIKFKKLGLVVVDEQHRFGVQQRAKLVKENGKDQKIPHFLSMTATPIPRTLALALYGDLSISQIRELPIGRKEIITKLVGPKGRIEVYEFLRMQTKKGRQGFVVCPLIEESEKLELTAAKKEFQRLKTKVFPELNMGLLHGKIKPSEKDKIMRDFKNKKIDILVSTPVVEVGIDVPNATIMIIEGSERFGLAQLYQFRGRVGRGRNQSYCYLFTDSPEKQNSRRLKAVVSAKNAFELAEKDLKIRGPGDFIGERQSGLPDLTMTSLTDIDLISNVKKEVEKIIQEDISLKKYPNLNREVEKLGEKVFLE